MQINTPQTRYKLKMFASEIDMLFYGELYVIHTWDKMLYFHYIIIKTTVLTMSSSYQSKSMYEFALKGAEDGFDYL